jgi:hypothetical protein
MAVGLDLGVVAYPAQQAIGDARRTAGAPGDLGGAVRIGGDARICAERARSGQVVGVVELEALHDAEAVAQGRGQEAGAGGGPPA